MYHIPYTRYLLYTAMSDGGYCCVLYIINNIIHTYRTSTALTFPTVRPRPKHSIMEEETETLDKNYCSKKLWTLLLELSANQDE